MPNNDERKTKRNNKIQNISRTKTAKAQSGKVSKSVRQRLTKAVKKRAKKSPLAMAIILFFVLLTSVGGIGYVTETQSLWLSNFYYDTFYDFFDKTPTYEGTYAKEGEELAVHFVDVEQGDCIIIQLPDGKNMIIDAGPRSQKNKVLAYIDYLEITKFDYLLLTHSDEDHSGNMDDVLQKCEVEKIFMPEVTTKQVSTAVYKDFCDAVDKENAEVEYSNADSVIIGESYNIDFVTPTLEKYDQKYSTAAQKNSISPIIILEFAGKKIMFTGDATTAESENWFLEYANTVADKDYFDVDVLKVAHHGGKDSTCKEFLDTICAENFVISVGTDNKYGHPHASLLTRLQVSASTNLDDENKIYRTDKSGDIALNIAYNGEFEWQFQKTA